MKIVVATPFYPPEGFGGGPVTARAISRTLAQSGHSVYVVTCADQQSVRDDDGITVQTTPGPNIYWNYFEPHSAVEKVVWHTLENYNPRAYRQMHSILTEERPDLLLTISVENINVASWSAAKDLGIPTLHFIQSGYLLCWKGTMQKGSHNCATQCAECRATSVGKRLMSQKVDAVSAETDFIIERHTDAGYFKSALARSVPSAIERLFASKPRSYPKDRPLRVGYLGVHIPYKGLDVLAEAAKQLVSGVHTSNELPTVRAIEFHIAGTGEDPYASEIRDKFPSTATTFHGWVNANEFLAEIDLLVVPSIGKEPFGRVSIEAFAHAVPVLASNIGGLPETINPGQNGDLFDPGNSGELAEKIAKLCETPDRYEAWSEGALSSASDYLPGKIAGRLHALLEDVVHRGAGNRTEVDLQAAE